MPLQIINLLIAYGILTLIWVIQLTHYPSFKYIDKDQFQAFHNHHTSSITIVVMPLMLAELFLSGWLFYTEGVSFLAPLLMVLLNWASTFFIQIPLHHKLENGKDLVVIQQLVNTNWIRTLLWTVKAVWLTLLFFYF